MRCRTETCTKRGNLGRGPRQERGSKHEGYGTCPDVFSISDDGVAVAIEEDVPEEAEDAAQEAADNCPVSAIVVE